MRKIISYLLIFLLTSCNQDFSFANTKTPAENISTNCSTWDKNLNCTMVNQQLVDNAVDQLSSSGGLNWESIAGYQNGYILTAIGSNNVNWQAPGSSSGGVNWNQIGGTQSSVNVSGFTNDAGYLTGITANAPLSGSGTSGSHLIFTNPGYITGNQTITLGGILSGSGTTAITASAGSGYYMPTTSDQTTWNGKQANLNLAAGTYVNGDVCTYSSSGTLLNCNTSPGGTGTVTSVATDSSMTGGPITTTGTLSVNWPNMTTSNATGVNWQSFYPTASVGVTNWTNIDLLNLNQTITGTKTFSNTINGSISGNAATVTTNANLTGGVTSIGNAATVVTNANLTGPVTSVGNATSIASQAIQTAGINWASINSIAQLNSSAINWANINGLNPINSTGINWQFAGYGAGKALVATSGGGVNWQNFPSGGAINWQANPQVIQMWNINWLDAYAENQTVNWGNGNMVANSFISGSSGVMLNGSTGTAVFNAPVQATQVIDTGVTANSIPYVNGSQQLAAATLSGLTLSGGVLTATGGGASNWNQLQGNPDLINWAQWPNSFNGANGINWSTMSGYTTPIKFGGQITSGGTGPGHVQLYDSTGANWVSLDAPSSIGASVNWTLPTNTPTAGMVWTATGVGGGTNWSSAPGGGGGSGTVTSIGANSPNGTIQVSSTPVTSSGTIGYDVNWSNINGLGDINTGGLNWASINSIAKINSSSINWSNINSIATMNTGGINWASINSIANMNTSGLNWANINSIANLNGGGINWANINSVANINSSGINWQFVGYATGYGLVATSAGGVNWQPISAGGGSINWQAIPQAVQMINVNWSDAYNLTTGVNWAQSFLVANGVTALGSGAGYIKMYDSSGINWAELAAPGTINGTFNWTLPIDTPTTGWPITSINNNGMTWLPLTAAGVNWQALTQTTPYTINWYDITTMNNSWTNPEYSNGTCTTSVTINPTNGNRQKVTLTNGDTCALTLAQPSIGTAVVTLKIIQSSTSTYNGIISGCKWPGGTVLTPTATTGAIDYISIYYDGTNAYCSPVGQAFS